MSNENFLVDQEQLNLQSNKRGVLECRGRLQGDYPRDYTPWGSILNDDECERKILGTPTAEVSQENSEELQWVQTP